MTEPKSTTERLDAIDEQLIHACREWVELARDHLTNAANLERNNDGRPKKELGTVTAWADQHRERMWKEEQRASEALREAMKLREEILGQKKRGPAPRMLASDAAAKPRDAATAALLAKKKQREDEAAARKAERLAEKAMTVAPQVAPLDDAVPLGAVADLESEEAGQ